MKEGTFIVIEGGDGAGKTMQVELLRLALVRRGMEVVTVRFPGETVIGKEIRATLLANRPEHEKPHPLADLLLYAADRINTEAKVILPALNDGKVVIADRYSYSTQAYQGAGSGIDSGWTDSLCETLTLGAEHSLVVFLDVEPELGLRRAHAAKGGLDRFESEDLQFRERVRLAYRGLYESAVNEGFDALWIDTSDKTPEAVHRMIMHATAAFLDPVVVEDD